MFPFKKKQTSDISELRKSLDYLKRKAEAIELGRPLRFVQVEYRNEGDEQNGYTGGDSKYKEFISNLLASPDFQWFIYKRQMRLIDEMNAINPAEHGAVEMRAAAARRMEGIQSLINDMAAIRKAHMISKFSEDGGLV